MNQGEMGLDGLEVVGLVEVTHEAVGEVGGLVGGGLHLGLGRSG